MLLLCFLASIVSEEKLAAKQPYLYLSICNEIFFLWLFEDFLFITSFEQSNYDVALCNFLSISCVQVYLASWIYGFIVLSNVEIFWLVLHFFPVPHPFLLIFRDYKYTVRLLKVVHSSLTFFSLFSSFSPFPRDSF